MRVTEKMMFQAGQVQTGAARERLEKALGEVTSGKRFVHPSDDPAGSGLLVTAKAAQQRHAAIDQSVGRAADELNFAEGVVGEVSNLVQRGRELAMQLGSGQYGASDRSNAAKEVDGLFNSLVGLMNSEVGGRYIFGGTQDGSLPFDTNGNYVGDANGRQIEIAPGVLQTVSLRADVGIKGVGGGTDVMQVFRDLSTAMRANDVPGIEAALSGLDNSLTQVSSLRTDAGSALSILQTSSEVASLNRHQMTIAVANISEVDLAEAASKMALASTALQAALSATANSFKLSLIDKL